MNQNSQYANTNHLIRALGLKESIAIVVGTIIGTGVFLKAAVMSQVLPKTSWVMVAWIVGGALSFTGALVYAELGSRLPKAGGEYQYLKHSYGSLVSFLFGWMRFLIATPGSIAAYAVGAAGFIAPVIGNTNSGNSQKITAVLFVLIFTLVNCFAVAIGGIVQTIFTFIKFVMIFGLSILIFFFAPPISSAALNFNNSINASTGNIPQFSMTAFGTALIASLWAYDGWNNLSMVAGEIKDPAKNIPKSLIIGVLFVCIIYLCINLSYFHALPIHEIMSSKSSLHPDSLPVATKAVATFLGDQSIIIISICFTLSALGAMNGSILTGARIPFAMAQDGLFFTFLSKINSHSSVPVLSVLTQGVVSAILALSGTFDQLTDMVVFASWIFYALTAASIFKLRYSNENIFGYKTPGFPYTPIVFVICSIALLINTLWTTPRESLFGLMTIALGIPVYFYFNKLKSQKPTL